MKRSPVAGISIEILIACLLALIPAGCSQSDTRSSNPDPEKVKQEADRLRQQNEKMFKP